MINGHSFNYLKFLLSNELNALYTSIVLRSLAFSMVGIFVPLYLYKELGYGLNQVIYFYLIYSVLFGVFSFFPSIKLVDKLSFKYIVLICSPLYILFFVLLYFLKFNPNLFFVLPAISGFTNALFWLAFHFEFSNISDHDKRGKEIGTWYNFSLIAGLVGPMMGGAILLFSGFSLLFLLVGILMFGSAVPMFFSEHKNKRVEVKLGRVFDRKHIKDGMAFLGSGAVTMVSVVFWPIFIYSILKGYLKMGSLVTAVSLITILFTFIVARLSDKYDRRGLMRIGALLQTIAWFVKMFVRTKLQLVGIYIFSGLSAMGVNVPFLALTYDKSKQREEYFVMREAYMCVGRILVLLFVLWSGDLVHGFLFASIFSLFYMWL